MEIRTIESPKGQISQFELTADESITDASDFLGIIHSCSTEIVAISRDSLAEDFFNLRSGLAGEILQKVSNYQRKLIILGDFSDLSSKAWKDFIFESNGGGRVLFVSSIDEAIQFLR